MGKRELLLIAAFVLVGAVVYQITKPASDPGRPGFSISRIIDQIRREIGGNRGNAEVKSADVHPLSSSTAELRVDIRTARIAVVGEDRSDLASELEVRSSGRDNAEAVQLAKATRLQLEQISDSVVARIEFPDPGVQRATLVLRIPSRLRVRIEPNSGGLTITNVAAGEIVTSRGETTIKGIADRLTITHRGGDLAVEDVGSLRLNTRGSDVRLARIQGEATLQMQAGELRAQEIRGALEIESNGTDLTLEKLGALAGILRINAVSGQVTLRDLQSEARVDGRSAEIDVRLERPVPLAIYSANEPVDITMAPGGYQLDAVATDGRITIAPALQSSIAVTAEADSKPEHQAKGTRATGTVGGGGPTITIRVTRADIRVMSATDTAP